MNGKRRTAPNLRRVSYVVPIQRDNVEALVEPDVHCDCIAGTPDLEAVVPILGEDPFSKVLRHTLVWVAVGSNVEASALFSRVRN